MRNKKAHMTLGSDMDSGSDHRAHFAGHRQIIQSRSKLLNRTDRILLDLVFEGKYTQVQLAALLGISESSLSYHIDRLTKILGQGYLALFRQPGESGVRDWKVARMAFLKGQSLATIARQTGLSLYQVRKIVTNFKTRSESNTKSVRNLQS